MANIILGATGHVGAAAARALLDRGAPVTIVTRDAAKGDRLRRRGATVVVADIHDVMALRAVFRGGRRAFLLNPPADPATDTDVEERATVRAILDALDGSGLEAVVAESTYGAQPGERIGDLSVLHEFEQGLRAQPIPARIIRAAYYMSNWDALLSPVRETGVLETMYPRDLAIPMVAPADLGAVAARLLVEPIPAFALHPGEGPARYSAGDVADAFARALARPVRIAVTPRAKWEDAFRAHGFSDAAARSYARMTAVSVDGGFDMPGSFERGETTLDRYIAALVARADG